jgi:hypothetical protein
MADERRQEGLVTTRQVAVVVVHGVGETTPGYAVNELVDTIERQFPGEFLAKRHSEVHPMSGEPLFAGDRPDSFPATVRSAHLPRTGESVRFYELYWADRTRTLPGRLNAFLGTFRIIFESHQFIDAMLPKDGGPLTRALRRLLLVAAALLRGPIAALNICLIAIALALYFGAPLLRDGSGQALALEPGQMIAVVAVVMAAVAAGALVFLWRRWRRHNTEWNDVYVATLLGALFVVGFAWLLNTFPHVELIAGKLKPEPTVPTNPVCLFVDRFFYVSQLLWAVWGIVMVAALAVLGLLMGGRSRAEASRGAAEAAIGVVAIQSALWIAVICIFAVPMLREANLRNIEVCSLDRLYFFFAGAAVWSLIVAGTAAGIYWWRWLVARVPAMSLEYRARLTPRMLFGGPIVFAIIVGVVANLIIFYVQFLEQFGQANKLLNHLSTAFLSQETMETFVKWVTSQRERFFTTMSAVAGAAGLLLAGGFTTALHIARDLSDPHSSPRLGYSHYLLPPRLRGHLPPRPRRERLRTRLNTVAQELVCSEGFDDVVFVVHSQGSVIAYDFLASGGGVCERLLSARPHLVTFGSPLGHLYQFYFKEYASLHASIAALRPRLASWANLYRVDDYVGREIADPDGFVQNIVMPAGGHIDYWKERKLAEAVLERIRTPGGAGAPAAGQAA